MRVLVAVADGDRLAVELVHEGIEIVGVLAPEALALLARDDLPEPDASAALRALADADAVVLTVSRAVVDASVVALCDRARTRIVPVASRTDDIRAAEALGLESPLAPDVPVWRLCEVLAAAPAVAVAAPPSTGPAVIVVWGPAGAPGRSTIAAGLAVELARGGRRTALVDADTAAPSQALSLSLPDEGPGFAAACRSAERGALDAAELTRIALPLRDTGVEVLTGVNRPSRWPELSAPRVTAALEATRGWVDHVVVDVAAPLERDEEIVSDLADGPRRNAATVAALQAADLVVAVGAADPVGIARYLRGHSELKAIVGSTPVVSVINRVRPGVLGIDARGQVRRALDRFGGIGDVWFLPHDGKSADAALLAARPIGLVAPRSGVTLGIRRLVGEAILPPPPAVPADSVVPTRRVRAARPRRGERAALSTRA
ncbi:hypothetical protein ABXJ56_11205 [Microbacterium chocolatum]|uniref:AAA family ATPase n=1 Tax=Microbacterium aurantiacum TaxID=162393 RepID=UPI003390235B